MVLEQRFVLFVPGFLGDLGGKTLRIRVAQMIFEPVAGVAATS